MNTSATLNNEDDDRLDISKQEKIVSTFENSDSDSDEGQDTSKQQQDIANKTTDDPKKYWLSKVHPELNTDKCIDMNFDSRLKTTIFSGLMYVVRAPISEGVSVKKVKCGYYYYPKNGDDKSKSISTSAILWIHGGGRVMGSAGGMLDEVCSKIVLQFNLPVLSVHYRLAPRHPFPAGLNDIHSGYHWLVEHIAKESGSSSARIAIAGDSAGGGLAAEICQRLYDEHKTSTTQTIPLPACQLLINPMLDDRTCCSEQLSSMPPHLVWNHKSNSYAWKSYLGRKYKPGDEMIPKYAAASRRTDLSGLPPCYILIGDLDIFHEESKDYATRLEEHGVEIELDEILGGFHGIMSNNLKDQPIVDAWERCHAFSKKYMFD